MQHLEDPKEICEKCVVELGVVGVGSASGRIYYKCPKCGAQKIGKNPAAVAFGALGGKARAAALSPEERQRIAKNAGDTFAENMRERRKNQSTTK